MKFSSDWKNASSERSEGKVWLWHFMAMFTEVSGALPVNPKETFEHIVKSRRNTDNSVDFYWKDKIAVEMKSRGKDLDKAFKQLQGYMSQLPKGEEPPDLWMVSDFETIRIWHGERDKYREFKTADLNNHVQCFAVLADYEPEYMLPTDKESVNAKAAEKMARIHDALEAYNYVGVDLQVYMARLLFCLFADDTGIFPPATFFRYVSGSKEDGSDLAGRLDELFSDLAKPEQDRVIRPNVNQADFRHINGGLFNEKLECASFDDRMRQALLDCLEFNWGSISPAIFGSMFQGVMQKKSRREIGAHYTSEENILKLINPLFMDSLREEFAQAKKKANRKVIAEFHDKLAGLRFLDPACGCGNFLMIAYRELRRLETEVVREEMRLSRDRGHKLLNIETNFRVGVEQFYGIEIEEWPCEIARTGMWLMDHTMNMEASKEFGMYYDKLPLKASATIVCTNALRMDWESVVPKDELSYILGNPPFSGKKEVGKHPQKKKDMQLVFEGWEGYGKLDYVAAWYKKTTDMMSSTTVRAAFVSTNSITQGEQAPILWKPLMERGIYINFGVPSFKWKNDARGKAAVYCVIVGFSYNKTEPVISPYLTEAPTRFIKSRLSPLCDVPKIVTGNQATDDGHFYLDQTEYDEFVKLEPNARTYIRRAFCGDDFINGHTRYCLWLADVDSHSLKQMPHLLKRVAKVKEFRIASDKEATRQWAKYPTLFTENRQPDTEYLVIPKVSSEKRAYIPIGFLSSDIICNNTLKIVPSATLYHFGVLSSNVHNSWMRAVAGRLEMRYQYSNTIVYNNFPWPDATDKQKTAIEYLAQSVLNARNEYPDSSLADLYDSLTMPPKLAKAHQDLDRAVMKLYGFPKNVLEDEIVAELMERYKRLIEQT